MKKSLLLLCMAFLLGAVMLAEGFLPALLAAAALIPILLGPVVSAYFNSGYMDERGIRK